MKFSSVTKADLTHFGKNKFLGDFLNNKKYSQSCSALPLNIHMKQYPALRSSKEDEFSIKLFKVALINMVAKVPGGKEFSSENWKLIDEAGAYGAVYFLDFVAKSGCLASWILLKSILK